MKQEKIGNLIKKIRQESNLTQEKFAQKYGVTYQAVSKWENGKSLPDITILKKICDDNQYDLNSFLNGTEIKYKKSKLYFIIPIIFIIIILAFLLIQKLTNKDDFNFSALSTTCDNFKLYGSIAYSENKTAIYISNITYCGEENKKEYQKIECTLYEKDEKTKNEISRYEYNQNFPITLDAFLKDFNFNIDNYSQTCKNFKENGLILEITATSLENVTEFYEIPLKLDDNCK